MIKLKKEYNRLIEREKNGQKWLESANGKEPNFEKILKEYNNVVKELSKIISKIDNATQYEIENGFKI